MDWINPTGAKKIHSLIDKVYKQKNLEMAWEKVKENRGSGGVDGQTLDAFEAQPIQLLVQLRFEIVESLPIDTSTAPVFFHLLPGHLQVLPLVHLVN